LAQISAKQASQIKPDSASPDDVFMQDESASKATKPQQPQKVSKDLDADMVSQQSTCFDSQSLREFDSLPPLSSANEIRDFSKLLTKSNAAISKFGHKTKCDYV
jgi:hypothetical protein